MRDRLRNTARGARDNGEAGRGRFERHDTEPLGQRRVNEQVECAQQVVEVVSEPRETQGIRQPKRAGLCLQVAVELTLAEQYEPHSRMLGTKACKRLQQVPVAFALDQLPSRRDRKIVGFDAELTSQNVSVR